MCVRSDLEQAVESLSELLERPLEEDKIAELRQQTTDKTVYVMKRCKVLLEDTLRGYDEVSLHSFLFYHLGTLSIRERSLTEFTSLCRIDGSGKTQFTSKIYLSSFSRIFRFRISLVPRSQLPIRYFSPYPSHLATLPLYLSSILLLPLALSTLLSHNYTRSCFCLFLVAHTFPSLCLAIPLLSLSTLLSSL